MLRLTVPTIEEDDLEAVRQVLLSGMLVQGPRVEQFEKALAESLGIAHAVAVSSGTAALHLALLAMQVGPGDLVAVPTYSWVATANVVEIVGARPVFVDIDRDSFNLDPAALERVLAVHGEKVKVVLPVHAFGMPANLPAIRNLADRHGAPLLEDAACALGASLGGEAAGTVGHAGCFSFHPRKAVTTGEGGAVVTSDAALAERVRTLRNHGQDAGPGQAGFVAAGYNYRMTEIQAALGATQLAKLDRILAARRAAARLYDELLAGSPYRPQAGLENSVPAVQTYVVAREGFDREARDAAVAKLREQEIEASIGTIHIPLTPYYRERYGHREGDFPVTDEVAATSISLPLFPGITEEQQRTVVTALPD